ncbi:ribonuclease H family protein, partial [Pseudomonas syringae]|uniref:ribonuclease H family protein n=1 Tax=Pseudomonas syringae TaxID=317 RepID=UPI0034D56C75
MRSQHGLWLFGFAGFIGISDCLRAELLAILHGLRLCWDRGFRRVDLFSDSTLALSLLSKDPLVFHSYAAIINQIKCLLRRDW